MADLILSLPPAAPPVSLASVGQHGLNRSTYQFAIDRAREAISVLVQTEGSNDIVDAAPGIGEAIREDAFDASYFPFPERNFTAMELPVDYKELIERLRTKADLEGLPKQQVTIVFRRKDAWRTEVWQLAPLSATLLRLCDGKRTVQEVTDEFALLGDDTEGVPLEKVCLFGLMQLRREGLIAVSRRTVFEAEAQGIDGENARSILRYSPPPHMSNTQQPWPWSPSRGSAVSVRE